MTSSVVVITGAAGGLGRTLCRHYAQRQWTVVALDRDPDGLDGLAQSVTRERLTTKVVDLLAATAIEQCFTDILADHERIDVLINNAGVTHISAASSLTTDTLDKVMAINFRGAALCAVAAIPALRASGGSHVAISSVAGFSPLVKRAVYSASKHALGGFFDTLRAEEREHGVHVLTVYPSFIATNPGDHDTASDIQRPGAASDAIDQITPDAAARAIMRAIDNRQDRAYLGRVAWLASWIVRLSPRLYEWLMLRSLAKG